MLSGETFSIYDLRFTIHQGVLCLVQDLKLL